MFSTSVDQGRRTARIVVRPSNSMTWRGNLTLFATLVAVSFSIAIGFALNGLWMVLPFAGLEMVVVALGLYLTARRLADNEVIRISEHVIQVDTGYRQVQTTRRVNRNWARIELSRRGPRGYPSSLRVRSHAESIEVGACLTEGERRELARTLRGLLADTED